jgi:flavorubredoxin
MDTPKMFEPYLAAADIHVLPSYFPIPGMGILPINAFVLKAREPVLVDTGQALVSDQFIKKLSSVIDPPDLRWLFLTHVDPDHIGSLERILEIAPQLRIITTYLALGKMSLFKPLPIERVYLLNPGQSINVGDRTLSAVKPPTYDAPETTAFFDSKTSAFFSADCFGALMTEPVENAAAIGSKQLREGLLTWTTIDSPWLHSVDRKVFALALDVIRAGSPKIILSSHLPAAYNMMEELLQLMADVPVQKAFVGPDQQALELMIKGRSAA